MIDNHKLNLHPADHLYIYSRHDAGNYPSPCTSYAIAWTLTITITPIILAQADYPTIQTNYAHPLEWARDCLADHLDVQAVEDPAEIDKHASHPPGWHYMGPSQNTILHQELLDTVALLDDILNHLAYEATHGC